MKPFDQVTRLTQRKRWRRLGETALQRYGIEKAQLCFVSDTDNVVFRVHTPETRYALRIDPEPAHDKRLVIIEAEMCWLAALRQDTMLLVPGPVWTRDGALVPVVSARGVPGKHSVTLLEWLPGQLVGNCPTPAVLTKMGASMARLHNHSEQFSFPNGITRPRPRWHQLAYWLDPQNDTSATLTPRQRDLCALAAKRLLVDIDHIGTGQDYGLIHADLHPGNCLLYKGVLGVIDFEDCRFGSHFYDISVPLTFLSEHDTYETLRAAFYKGYNRVRPLPDRTEAAVQVFMVARAFDNIAWIHFAWPSLTHHPWGPALVDSAVRQIGAYIQ
jgi:Ser/Thr protein kinase RdoA (MazF antagonist)